MKSLRAGGRGGTDTGERKVWNSLVAAEVALAVTLLVASGLLIRSFWHVLEVDLGFTPDQVVTAGLYLPESRYEDAEAMAASWIPARRATGIQPTEVLRAE